MKLIGNMAKKHAHSPRCAIRAARLLPFAFLGAITPSPKPFFSAAAPIAAAQPDKKETMVFNIAGKEGAKGFGKITIRLDSLSVGKQSKLVACFTVSFPDNSSADINLPQGGVKVLEDTDVIYFFSGGKTTKEPLSAELTVETSPSPSK